jgi:hypothetical protein
MNISDREKEDMIDKTHEYLLANPVIVNSITALPAKVTRLGELDIAILAKDRDKKSKTEGKSDKKKLEETRLGDLLFSVANGLYAFAVDDDNEEIKATAKLTRSKIKNLADIDLYNTAVTIAELAEGRDLTGYSITSTDVTDLKGAAENFKKASADIAKSVAERVGAKKSLKQLFDEAIVLLTDEIDPVINTQITKQPEFYNGYKAARVIWNQGSRGGGTPEQPEQPSTPAI